jgi:NTE family protein
MRKFCFSLFLLPLVCIAQNNYPYKNLVLEGGGIRGLAYAGACSVLEQEGVLHNIENVGGSSAGSIAGLLICLGYTATEIDSLLTHLPIQKFNDGKGGLIGKYKRVTHKFGVYKGKVFEDWLLQLVENKTSNAQLNFLQLHQLHQSNNTFKDLYCTGTNLSKQALQVFSWQQTPQVPIALAVRISCGIPMYFEPVALTNNFERIKKITDTTFANYFVDGGLVCNYPICFFDSCIGNATTPLHCDKVVFNNQTIGIKLERPQQIDSFNNSSIQIPAYTINKLPDYINAFGNLLMETLSRKYPGLENEKGRTIYVNQGNLSPKIKKISAEQKRQMFNNGVQAAQQFLQLHH